MIRHIPTFLMLLLPFSSYASNSCGVLSAPCSCGVRADSYAYGLKAGLTGTGSLPAGRSDERCYSYGVNDGKKVAKENHSYCFQDFDYSFEQGATGKPHSSSLSSCNHIGYRYGEAFLRVSARNRDVQAVGRRCINAYDMGALLAKEGRVYTIENDYFINACKLAGYYGIIRD